MLLSWRALNPWWGCPGGLEDGRVGSWAEGSTRVSLEGPPPATGAWEAGGEGSPPAATPAPAQLGRLRDMGCSQG